MDLPNSGAQKRSHHLAPQKNRSLAENPYNFLVTPSQLYSNTPRNPTLLTQAPSPPTGVDGLAGICDLNSSICVST